MKNKCNCKKNWEAQGRMNHFLSQNDKLFVELNKLTWRQIKRLLFAWGLLIVLQLTSLVISVIK